MDKKLTSGIVTIGESCVAWTNQEVESGVWCVEANWHLVKDGVTKDSKTRTAYDAPLTPDDMEKKLQKKLDKFTAEEQV